MKRVMRALPLIAGVVVLASCGGGGGSSSSTTPVVTAKASAVTPFAVTVASSAGVTGVGITSPLESGSPEHLIATSGASAQCTTAGALKTCTASLTLPAGTQDLGVIVHAAKTSTGKLHATVSSARIALAVGTTVAQISLDLALPQLSGGVAATTTLYVTARDSNGNTIVGDYGGTTIALASSDPSVTLAPASVTTGGTTVTVTYSGSQTVASSVTLSATASGIASSAIVNATLGFTSSQVFFVGGGSGFGQTILEFPVSDNGNVAAMRRTLVSGIGGLSDISPDGKGNLTFCASASPIGAPIVLLNGITIYPQLLETIPMPQSDGTVVPTVLNPPLPTQTVIWDCESDGHGTNYVLYVGQTTGILAMPSGSSTPSQTITGAATGLSGGSVTAVDLAVGPDDSIYVSTLDSTGTIPEIVVFAPGATGNVAPVRVISGSATTLSAAALQYYQTEPITVGSDGSLYVLDVAEGPDPQLPGNLRVLVFPPNANGNVAPSRIITGGLTELSQPTAGAFGLVDQNGRGALGIAVDATGRIYVGTYTGVASILGFAAGATGNVEPTTVLSGPLTNMIAYDVKIGSATVTAAAASGPPSVSGDFLAYAANRGWNYVATPAGTYYSSPPPSFVLTLYADPTTSANTAPFSVLEGPAGLPDATAGVHASDATFDTTDGYTATSATSITNGFSFSSALAGGIKVVPPSLTQGQTFVPYPGITATVVNVGFVPGSSACPNPTTAIGATVSYTIGFLNETISYVPGCGITDMVTDNGTEFRLQSIGTYNLGTLSVRRESMAETVIKALSQTWKSVFTPWSPHR